MSNKISEELAYTIGVQAYIYGYPTMDLYRTFYENAIDPKRGHEYTLNEFIHSKKLITPEDKWVVSPNNDNLYSRAFLDLSNEPIILKIPVIGDRPYWFPVGNIYHNLITSLSWDTVGRDGGAFAFCPPGYNELIPEDVERVDVNTPYIWILGRYYVTGVDDVTAVNKLQDNTHLIPISQWGNKNISRPVVDAKCYPKMIKDDLKDPAKYYTVFNEMLRRNPPLKREETLLNWFKEINLHPHQQFDWENLDPDVKKGLEKAVDTGYEIVLAKTKSFARIINGWLELILEADMGPDPVNHAGLCMMGLLYSQKEVSTYHIAYVDGDEKTLDGNNKYEVNFDPVPPVEAFWSLAIYDESTRLYAPNSINRYAIGDRTPGIKYNVDDSLTIYIQNEEPVEEDKKPKWLPVPKGPFYLVLREYTSKSKIFTREWVPPEVKRIG